MQQPHFKLYLILLVFFQIFKGSPALECIDVSSPRTRTFYSLRDYQANSIPFNVTNDSSAGNYVAFANNVTMETLQKNAFVTMDSGMILKLFLQNHHIEEIDDGAFISLNCVTILNLRGNQIGKISRGIFSDLHRLRDLDLGENVLEEVPERVFLQNRGLRKLNLTHNHIRAIQTESFLELTALEELDLGYNYLQKLHPEAFQLPNLRRLRLDGNYLERVEFERFILPKLAILNLTYNNLESFDTSYSFNFSSTLIELYLSENWLKDINELSLRRNLPSLKKIDIDGNDWSCPRLMALLKVLNDSRIDYKDSNDFDEPNINGVGCNKSSETYHRKQLPITTTEEPSLPPLVFPDTTATSQLYMTNVKILDSIKNLQTIVVCLLVIIIVFIFVDVSVRTGCLTAIMQRRRNQGVLDNSDVENFALLRERF